MANHVSIGGDSSTDGMISFEAVERVARPRDIARPQMVVSGTDSEAEGRVFTVRARDINSNTGTAEGGCGSAGEQEEEGVEVSARARDINGPSLGPKGLLLPKWDVKEHGAAALETEQKVSALQGASVHLPWIVKVGDIKRLIPVSSTDGKALLLGVHSSMYTQALVDMGYQVETSLDADGDLRRLSFPDNTFSLILDQGSLDSVLGDLATARCTRELHRMLSSDGTLVCMSRRNRESLFRSALPGLGMPQWSVGVQRVDAVIDAAEMEVRQRDLARSLGQLHQSVPAKSDERDKLKSLCVAALGANSTVNGRHSLEDEALVLCRLYAPHLQSTLAQALKSFFTAKDPVPGGAFVHTCVRGGVSCGAGEDEGLADAMRYMEGVLNLMREEEGCGIMSAGDIVRALGQ